MTPGQAQWGMWLFGAMCGGVLGVLIGCLGAANSHSRMADRIGDLRVALGDLVRAVGSGDWRPYRDTETGRQTLEALKRARDVLDGKGADGP